MLSTFAIGGILASVMGRFMLARMDWRMIFVLDSVLTENDFGIVLA